MLSQQLVGAGEIVLDVNRAACRLHSLLAELAPAGTPSRINGSKAQRLLDQVEPATPMEAMCLEIAYEHLDDLRRLDAQLAASRNRLTAAVTESHLSAVPSRR